MAFIFKRQAQPHISTLLLNFSPIIPLLLANFVISIDYRTDEDSASADRQYFYIASHKLRPLA
jgi:hypothetical protein